MTEETFSASPPLCVVGNVNRDVKLLGVLGSTNLLLDGETPVSNVGDSCVARVLVVGGGQQL